MNETEVMQIADEMIDIAKSNYTRDGHLVPVAFGMKDGGLAIIDLRELLHNDESKEHLRLYLQSLALQKGFQAILFLCEAWMVEGKKGETLEQLTEVKPEDNPRRIECINCILEFQDMTKTRVIEISKGAIKDDRGWDGLNKTEGRMTGFLPR